MDTGRGMAQEYVPNATCAISSAVEQVTLNDRAGGSNPSWRTQYNFLLGGKMSTKTTVTSASINPSDDDLTKSTVLSMIAEGKPFVFVTGEIVTNDLGDALVTTVLTDIPPVIGTELLKNALESLTSDEAKEAEQQVLASLAD